MEDSFFMDRGWGDGSGANASDGSGGNMSIGGNGSGSSASDGSGSNVSDGEQQMKLCSLACRSPPAVWPGS